MKKRFLPFSLLLVIMIFGQSVMADQVGHYVPRGKQNSSVEAYLHSLRANQNTGMIDPACLIAASKQMQRNVKGDTTPAYDSIIYWKSMGPDNMGGRTTAVLFNNQKANEAVIGSMGGGVFYTWNQGVSWHQIGESLLVSCMAQKEDGTIYVGTGDCGVAYSYNGMADYGYTNSFVGSGLYTINKAKEMQPVPGTSPTDPNDAADEWAFINDIAIDGETVIVATNAGVKYLKGGEWVYAQVVDSTAESGYRDLAGEAIEVRADQGLIVASVEKNLYIGTLDAMVCKSASNDVVYNETPGVFSEIEVANTLFDVAVDSNMVYVANIKDDGTHAKIYCSEDFGATWKIILPSLGAAYGHQVYGERGIYNHRIVVDPIKAGRIYILANELWALQKPETPDEKYSNYYVATQLSFYTSLHNGINDLAFNPNDDLGLYVATDGGIYKGQRLSDGIYFGFTNCNRGYLSSRCLGIAPTGSVSRVVAGVLEQGPIVIEGRMGTNNAGTAELLLPERTGAHFGIFKEAYNCASCYASTIQPDAFIFTTYQTEAEVDGAIYRTKTAGVDYDKSNLTKNLSSFTFKGVHIPIAFWETLHDEYSTAEVWFKCKRNYKEGDPILIYSNTGDFPSTYPDPGYPLHVTAPYDLYYNPEHPHESDSVAFNDPISSKLLVPVRQSNGKKFDIYYTTNGIQFAKAAVWTKVGTIEASKAELATPTCMAISADGDNAYVGTRAAGLARITNMRHAVDSATYTASSSEYALHFNTIALPEEYADRCVTSVAFFTDDPNKLVVTLGNYGNECYVLYTENALDDEPVFVGKQGNLPAMPVYSSVFTSTYDGEEKGHVLIGTEHGIFRTLDITAAEPVWVSESANIGDVPVMELRQQLIHSEEEEVVFVLDSVNTKRYVYPGTNNQGVIYAATYGRGLFRCETYRQNSGQGVSETPTVAKNDVKMYPNPVRDAAKVSFTLDNSASVNYQVYDMSGRMVRSESLGHFTEGKYEMNVSVNDLSKGAYILRLNAGSKVSSVKFMVF